jgi:hypothetical protein
MRTILQGSLGGLLILALLVLAAQTAAFRGRLRRARRLVERGRGAGAASQELGGLPAPARRFLSRALPAAGPFATSVEVQIEQRVKIRKTQPDSPDHIYRMRELLAAGRGMAATGWLRRGTPRSVLFWYAQGEGQVREALFDLIPIVRSSGSDVSRSLRGRALCDLFWLPSALLPANGASWEAVDDEHARVTVELDGEELPITLRIDAEGRLLELTAPRWGSVGTGGGYAQIPFGMTADEERTFDGYTIASRLRGGWWYATDRYVESLRLQVEDARFN